MRHPCIGFPLCMKTFENGHVLRAHHLSCPYALKKLNEDKQQHEHHQKIQYEPLSNQSKTKKCFQTLTGLDNTQKFLVRDRYQLGGSTDKEDFYRRIRQAPDPRIAVIQTKSSSVDFSGYYT